MEIFLGIIEDGMEVEAYRSRNAPLVASIVKALAEARSEVGYGASFIEWFSEEAKRAYGNVIPGHGFDKRILVIKKPIAVVTALTP